MQPGVMYKLFLIANLTAIIEKRKKDSFFSTGNKVKVIPRLSIYISVFIKVSAVIKWPNNKRLYE